MKQFLFLLGFLLSSSGLLTATPYYVNTAMPVSGDGLSAKTAWKTIQEATSFNLQPGDVVNIQPGTYHEGLYLTRSGAEIIPVTTGMAIQDNKIYFPDAVSLSEIDIETHTGEYFLYVYRSMNSNNGVFKILYVNDQQHYVEVEGSGFINETGADGDVFSLSCCIGRPVRYVNASENPESDRVVLDASTTELFTVAALGNFINNYDALPVNYNIIDGIDLTGSRYGGGWHIQSSNYNVIMNCRIYNMGVVSFENGAGGILVNGNETHPSQYNLFINNTIYNTPYEGIYIGAGNHPAFNNHAFFNHVIDNHIYTQGDAPNAVIENAVDVKEYNYGNVVEGNVIGPLQLATMYNGAIDIVHNAHHSLVYGNTIFNISKGTQDDIHYALGVNEYTAPSYVFNNLFYISDYQEGMVYAIYLNGTGNAGSYCSHNTIVDFPGGFLLGEGGTDVTVSNNIVVSSEPIEAWSNDFSLKDNLYSRTPSYYAGEPGRKIGNPFFYNPDEEDYRLTKESILAIDLASGLNPPVTIDIQGHIRNNPADRGACEFDPTTPLSYIIASEAFLIVPNPAGETVEIRLNNPSDDTIRFCIFDATGRLIMNGSAVSQSSLIDVSGLRSGLYAMRIYTPGGKEFSSLFSKQ